MLVRTDPSSRTSLLWWTVPHGERLRASLVTQLVRAATVRDRQDVVLMFTWGVLCATTPHFLSWGVVWKPWNVDECGKNNGPCSKRTKTFCWHSDGFGSGCLTLWLQSDSVFVCHRWCPWVSTAESVRAPQPLCEVSRYITSSQLGCHILPQFGDLKCQISQDQKHFMERHLPTVWRSFQICEHLEFALFLELSGVQDLVSFRLMSFCENCLTRMKTHQNHVKMCRKLKTF